MKQKNIIYRKVNRGFQITLPPEFRNKYHLEIGSTLSMTLEDNKLVVQPYISDKTYSLKKLQDIFSELDSLPQIARSEEELYNIINIEKKAARENIDENNN